MAEQIDPRLKDIKIKALTLRGEDLNLRIPPYMPACFIKPQKLEDAIQHRMGYPMESWYFKTPLDSIVEIPRREMIVIIPCQSRWYVATHGGRLHEFLPFVYDGENLKVYIRPMYKDDLVLPATLTLSVAASLVPDCKQNCEECFRKLMQKLVLGGVDTCFEENISGWGPTGSKA